MRPSARGFTLIEVMVALFILALTFIGVISTASHVSRTIDIIQEKTVALWVGQNALFEIRMGTIVELQDGSLFQNNVMMAGKPFQWKANVTRQEQYHRETVTVMQAKGGHPIVEVTVYEPL